MKTSRSAARRTPGEQLAPLTLTTLSHGAITLPDLDRVVHLQFRRFAGCPVCNLHLRSFARSVERLEAAQVRTIAFFHSSAELMQPYQGALPFPTVPDPERHFYRLFGVERSLRSLAHPSAAWAGLRGLFGAPSNPLAGGNDPLGLPADFLIARDGTLLDVHYGTHADDQWSVEEVIEKARGV